MQHDALAKWTGKNQEVNITRHHSREKLTSRQCVLRGRIPMSFAIARHEARIVFVPADGHLAAIIPPCHLDQQVAMPGDYRVGVTGTIGDYRVFSLNGAHDLGRNLSRLAGRHSVGLQQYCDPSPDDAHAGLAALQLAR